jgi:nucleoside-triphosphatase
VLTVKTTRTNYKLARKMPKNFLISGPPGSGKTSVIERAMSILRERGLRAGGIYCPEIRERGVRVGFRIIDIMTGEERMLAHVNQLTGPQVSKYRVNVANVDELSELAINRALDGADFLVIDEIAPMEINSEGFKRAVLAALDSPKPVLAVIHQRTMTGFIGNIKAREDVQIFEVTQGTRADLPDQLAKAMLKYCKSRA